MSDLHPSTEPTRPGPVRAIFCVVWVVVVCAAYCAAYGSALVGFARGAAERFPFIARLLELLHLGG